MKRISLFCLISFLAVSVGAQEFMLRRGGCMPQLEDATDAVSRRAPHRLPAIKTDWDSKRVYRQLVILVEYALDSVKFSMSDPVAVYNDIFNKKGYTQRNGAGCVADYFRDQSQGLCHLQFDIYGPYQVNFKAQPYASPNSSTKNYSKTAMREATLKFVNANPELDYSQYDWDGNGQIEQVVYVHAGYAGNISSQNVNVMGYHWPNTGTFSAVSTPDGKSISNFTSSAELWPNKTSCGIGTICHEFSHSLGLPDIYPVPNWTYTAVDEWDLMDGGNFTNYGWCPPSYSPQEKMCLGWLTPIELTEPVTITGLQPVSRGGEVYQIKHTDTEYLLLENRQWEGWDLGVPGKGLVIYHVNFIKSSWTSNSVNGTENAPFNYDLIHADNRDYLAWTSLIEDNKLSNYVNKPWLNKRFLSESPYPYWNDGVLANDSLTEHSVPATKMLTLNAAGSDMLSKSITNIRMASDGTVSFDFMGGSISTGIQNIFARKGNEQQTTGYYDMNGRRLQSIGKHGMYIQRKLDGSVKKMFK